MSISPTSNTLWACHVRVILRVLWISTQFLRWAIVLTRAHLVLIMLSTTMNMKVNFAHTQTSHSYVLNVHENTSWPIHNVFWDNVMLQPPCTYCASNLYDKLIELLCSKWWWEQMDRHREVAATMLWLMRPRVKKSWHVVIRSHDEFLH